VDQYGYDAVGNRLWFKQGSTNSSYAYGSYNRLSSIGPTTYSYDNNGSLKTQSSGSNTYNFYYDVENRLTKITQGSSNLGVYAYSPQGPRVKKVEGGISTIYVNHGSSVLYEKQVSGGNIVNDYIFAGSVLVAKVSGGSTFYFHQDQLGSTRLVDSSTTSFFTNYQPFGPQYGASGTDPIYKFIGRGQDVATGLYYLGSRYYDSSIGRFTSRDDGTNRLNDPQSSNSYTYARNNPETLSPADREVHAARLAGQFINSNRQAIAGSSAINSIETSAGNAWPSLQPYVDSPIFLSLVPPALLTLAVAFNSQNQARLVSQNGPLLLFMLGVSNPRTPVKHTFSNQDPLYSLLVIMLLTGLLGPGYLVTEAGFDKMRRRARKIATWRQKIPAMHRPIALEVQRRRNWYSRLAPIYDLITPLGFFHQETLLRRRAFNLLSPRKYGIILDLACGTGRSFPFLSEAATPEGVVIGIDFSKAMLTKAKARLRKMKRNNIQLICADVTHLPINQTPEIAISCLAMAVISNYERAVEEVARVLRPGGIFLVYDVSRSNRPTGFRALNISARLALADDSRQPLAKLGTSFRTKVYERHVLDYVYLWVGQRNDTNNSKFPPLNHLSGDCGEFN